MTKMTNAIGAIIIINRPDPNILKHLKTTIT